jgi:hypothetical protein
MVPDARPRRGSDHESRYFLFLRWIRVFLSSLRCFFLAMRLRRFLMTDPTRPPFLGTADDGHANALARLGQLDTQG